VTQQSQPASDTSRRQALAGLGLAGLAVTLTACGGSSSSAGGSTSGGSSSAGGSGGGKPLGPASAVPVGGGRIYTSAQVVVTQPSDGEYKAFSAVCTHAECILDQVADGTIDCPCHGSRFSVKDGSVVTGPATEPLPGVQVSVRSGQLSLG
jgi:Rieske Fe-S protein